jgi:hypothetical protein
MAIVTNITKTIAVPHEPGCEFVLRTLTWKQLESARKIQSDKNREEAKAFGAEFIRALTSTDTDEEATARARKRMRAFQYDVSQFDREQLLAWGIASWRGQGYDGVEANAEHKAALDEPTAVWAAEQIIAMSRPRTEDETKNS